MAEDEIKITSERTLKEFVESMRNTSMLEDPKLVRIAVTFRDPDGHIETRAMNHKSFDIEDYEE